MIERALQVEAVTDKQVMVVRGCVDEASTEDFRAALKSATVEYTQDLVVDLSDVDFLPSVAVGVLVATMKAGPAKVTLVAESGCTARQVLEICCLPCELPGASDASSAAGASSVTFLAVPPKLRMVQSAAQDPDPRLEAALREVNQLQGALTSNRVIGQATGVLMERYHLTAEVAFGVLLRFSTHDNVKLLNVAEQIIETRNGRPPVASDRGGTQWSRDISASTAD